MALKKVVSEILWLIVIKFIAGVVVSLPDGTCKIRNTVFPVTKSSRLTGKTIIASDWFLGLIGNDIKFICGYLQAQFSIKSLFLSILIGLAKIWIKQQRIFLVSGSLICS
jgi:hypothetical protein